MQTRRGITPWIEKLIGSYDRDEGIRTGGLQAHVVRVGHMSQSQALGWEGPTELLFLSDEQVQIPAVLTTSAWEELQDEEDLECFRSLVDHRLFITDYRLLFHRSSELSRSWFILSVGKLGTRAVVGINHITPCCTSLPSVRNKISHTWRATSDQQDTQQSQSGFDLTELLGEWQQDCLQTELEHVQKLLNVTPQPSTSTAPLPDTCTGTSWGTDMVCYKGSKSFGVIAKYLLIPDPLRQLNAEPQTGSESVGPSEKLESPESTNHQKSLFEVTIKQQRVSEDTVNFLEDGPVVLSGTGTSPMSNPWDMCPPPSNTSSTKSSPQASPVPHSPIFTESATNVRQVDTSTQMSAHSNGSQSELPTEPSLFPPYQKPLPSAPTPSSVSSKQSANALSSMSEAAEPNFSTATLETANKQLGQKCKRSLRKKSVHPSEDLVEILEEDEEEQVGSSPPSWMFESLICSTSDQSISQTQDPFGQLTEVCPSVHDDGKPFSYTYQVNGQELQHFSRFTVKQDLMHWAVKYLLRPEHSERNSADATATEAEDGLIIIS